MQYISHSLPSLMAGYFLYKTSVFPDSIDDLSEKKKEEQVVNTY